MAVPRRVCHPRRDVFPQDDRHPPRCQQLSVHRFPGDPLGDSATTGKPWLFYWFNYALINSIGLLFGRFRAISLDLFYMAAFAISLAWAIARLHTEDSRLDLLLRISLVVGSGARARQWNGPDDGGGGAPRADGGPGVRGDGRIDPALSSGAAGVERCGDRRQGDDDSRAASARAGVFRALERPDAVDCGRRDGRPCRECNRAPVARSAFRHRVRRDRRSVVSAPHRRETAAHGPAPGPVARVRRCQPRGRGRRVAPSRVPGSRTTSSRARVTGRGLPLSIRVHVRLRALLLSGDVGGAPLGPADRGREETVAGRGAPGRGTGHGRTAVHAVDGSLQVLA